MGKQSGLGDNFYVAQYDISGDTNAIGGIGGGPAALDVTGINKSAYERIGGQRSGQMEATVYFNPDNAHPALSGLPTSDVIFSYFRGTALGSPAASMVAKQATFSGNRADDGSFRFQVSAQSNGYGVEWGKQLTPGPRTDTDETDGDSVDFGVGATSFGLQAYLHVFEHSGGSVTVKLQESSDNSTWADVTDGAAAFDGAGAVRLETARDQTVERYLRATTSGTFDSVSFAVVVVRNDTSVSF
jgi:hypothetical protein